MNRNLLWFLSAAVLAVAPVAAATNAGPDDGPGRQLLRECEAAQTLRLVTLEGERGGDAVALNAGLCLGLLQTLTEMNELLPKPLFCPPSGAALGEAVRVVVDDLRRNAGRNDASRTTAALTALRSAYPCEP